MPLWDLMLKIIYAGIKPYEYRLKAVQLWQEILSNLSFMNFILSMSESTEARKMGIELYEKALKAYSLWIMVPAIVAVRGQQIEQDKDLNDFFMNWETYRTIHKRIWQDKEQEKLDDREIARRLDAYYSPLTRVYLGWQGSLMATVRDIITSVGYNLYQKFKALNSNINEFIEYIAQSYKDVNFLSVALITNPSDFFRISPTIDFDIIILFSHVKSLSTYKEILAKDTEAQANNPLPGELYAYLRIDGEDIMNLKLDEYKRIAFCLSKDMINLLRGKYAEIELGGAKRESRL